MADDRGDGRRAWLETSRRRDLHDPALRRRRWRFCSRSPSARAGISTSTSTRPPTRRRARSASIARDGARAQISRARSSSAIAARSRGRTTTSAQRTIDLVARAGLSVVSLPMCNMFLQDRAAPAARRAGAASPRCTNCKAAGVNVMIASDNTRDPFYAYGDLDMLEVWREGGAHPASRLSLRRLGARVVSRAPARAMGVESPALRVGRQRRHDLDRGARLHRIVRAAAIGSRRCCAAASRSPRRRPTMPNSTPWRGSRHEPRLRHRRVPRADRRRSGARTTRCWSSRRAATSTGIRRC